MNILIVEDEPLAAAHLQRMLHTYDPSIHFHPVLDTIRGAVSWLRAEPTPDLILMDIRLADGLSFSIFEDVPLEVPIIFTTAYDSFTIQAFKVNSVDYLLKPISYEDLSQAMDKFKRIHQKTAIPILDLEALKQAIQTPSHTFKKRFLVKKVDHLHAIPTSEILYFYAEDKVTFFTQDQGKRYLVEFTLQEIGEQVSPHEFFRINRKYMIRFESIEKMISLSARKIHLYLKHSNDSEIYVSRDRIADFKVWLGQ
ncbi:MAG: LytTR family DNA-binding domain-containing protein [Bacteroidota bacterium]